jgi:GntP family gluconate:H+ symporter
MAVGDARLVLAALTGIALAIFLIVRGRLHPFVALLCGAFVIGPLGGLSMVETAKAVQKGAGDILGSIGLVVALGMALGTMLQVSDGAAGLARVMIGKADSPRAPWMSLLVALLVGLPLFFETGLVLLLPIIASAATATSGQSGSDTRRRDDTKFGLILSALSGLSVVHALVPPHPGPLIAIGALGANLGRTIENQRVPVLRALLVVLLPVALILAGQVEAFLPASIAPHLAWLSIASNPVLALLVACLVAFPLLFGRRMGERVLQETIWFETMKSVGTILLAIGAGGALKQVLVGTGFAELLGRFATSASLSPILLGWSIAVAIRLATGSATVATITAAGVMPSAAIAASGVAPEWTVLAIGAGSLFFSHVNDPGFWLVKSYVGIDTPTMFRTWSVMETIISVVGLALVLLLSHLF